MIPLSSRFLVDFQASGIAAGSLLLLPEEVAYSDVAVAAEHWDRPAQVVVVADVHSVPLEAGARRLLLLH